MSGNDILIDLIGLFSEYHLNDISSDWVQNVFDANFTEYDAFAEANELQVANSPNLVELLERGTQLCHQYERESNDSVLWVKLAENEICPRSLVVILFYLLETGLRKGSPFNIQLASVAAAEQYLALNSISGAQAYNVFSSVLYQKCLDCLRLCFRLLGQKDARSCSAASGKRKRGKHAVPRASNRTREEEEDIVDVPENLNLDQLDTVRDMMGDFLRSLWHLLRCISLKDNRDSVISTAGVLVDLLPLDVDLEYKRSAKQDFENSSLTRKALVCLELLADSKHDSDCRVVLKSLLPRLLHLNLDGGAPERVPANVVRIKDLVLVFVCNLVAGGSNSEEFFSAVYILCQNLFVKVPDKAEYRGKVASTISSILNGCPDQVIEKFLNWLHKVSRNLKVSYRGFAVDLAYILLNNLDKTEMQKSREELTKLILSRCRDKAASVRTRALSRISSMLGVPGVESCDSAMPLADQAEQNVNGNALRIRQATVSLVQRESLLALIQKSSDDEKPLVRKAALQAMETFVAVIPMESCSDIFGILRARCADVSLSVRKQAAESLTRLLLTYPDNLIIQKCWLDGIMPLVVDREGSAQEKAADLLGSAVFKQLKASDSLKNMSWSLLCSIEKEKALGRYFCRAVRKLVEKKLVREDVLRELEEGTREPELAPAAWMLLAELSSYFSVSHRATRVAWMVTTDTSDRTLGYMARIFEKTANKMPCQEIEELLADMQKKIEEFHLGPENIGAVMYAAVQLMQLKTESEKEAERVKWVWLKSLVDHCEQYLSGLVFNEGNATSEVVEEEIIRRLFTLGEAVQYSPRLVSKRIFLIVEALVASDHLDHQLSSVNTKEENVNSQRISLPHSVKAHAVVTLGKLCLQEEESAKVCVGALVRELTTSPDPTVRNNIAVVLSDLCIRYTSLIDRHIGRVSLSLKDPSTLVRKQTLTLLTNLLKEDFLRWKGILLYRFVSTLLDEDQEVRLFSEFCLVHVLLVRFPQMFYLHFLECLYFFNGVKHPSWESKEVEGLSLENVKLFSLRGEQCREQRLKLYKFMLRQLSDQDKFSVAAKISADVLGSTVDGVLPYSAETKELLHDSLTVLASKEIKLSVQHGQVQDDGEEIEPAVAAAEAAKRALVSQVVKRATIERIIPNVMSLKLILEKRKSSLMKPLMCYLRELMRDYRSEIDEILAGDRQLVAEIQFDLRRFEAAEENRRRQSEALQPVEKDPIVQPEQFPVVADQTMKQGENVDVNNEVEMNVVAGDTTNGGKRPALSTVQDVVVDRDPYEPEFCAEFPSPLSTNAVSNSPKKCVVTVQTTPSIKVRKERVTLEEDEDPLAVSGLPARAISTPAHLSRLISGDVTFQLGKDFSTVVSPIRHNQDGQA